MMTKKSQTAIFVFIVCLWSGIALGQEDLGSSLLKIGIGARPAGLGGAFTALSDDINGLHWNPAGLGRFQGKELAFTHTVFVGDIREEFVGYAHFLGRLGTVGGGLTYLHLDEVHNRDALIASFTPYDLLGILTWAGKIGRDFEIGANLKYIYEKNREAEITKAGYFDVGGRASFRRLRFGFVFQNIGKDGDFEDKEDPLPQTVRGGIALGFFKDAVLVALDTIKEKDKDANYRLGVEYRPGGNLFLRLGAKLDEDEEAKITAGLGLTWKICRLDYAFLRHDRNSDNTHPLSLSLRF
ncbi:MAG: PorV/PorQ family protein [bacterium]|nr:PorV/PorQ family protein [bacterium]